MKFSKYSTIIFAAALLAGCSAADESLWPSLSGSDPAGPPKPAAAATASPPTRINIPAPKAPTFTASPQTAQTAASAPRAGQPSGTFVGRKVAQMRTDLGKLQRSVGELNKRMTQISTENIGSSQRYHVVVAEMNSKLQIGTTPGNPVLVKQWNEAQQKLEQIGESLGRMDKLSNDAAGEAGLAAWLLDSVRATYALSGAVDEDHRQLRVLEDEVNRTVVLIDRLLNELSEDVSRQTNYVSNERRNLTTMSLAVKNGELYGTSLVNRAFAQSQALASATAQSAGPVVGERPLVVIRFDRPNIQYQQALYNAVSRALERKPNASFDLVAVSPKRGSPAQAALNSTQSKRNAESVLRTLADMGLPGNRVKLSSRASQDVESNEVQIFVR
jgi:predicted nucleic acid-binding protein